MFLLCLRILRLSWAVFIMPLPSHYIECPVWVIDGVHIFGVRFSLSLSASLSLKVRFCDLFENELCAACCMRLLWAANNELHIHLYLGIGQMRNTQHKRLPTSTDNNNEKKCEKIKRERKERKKHTHRLFVCCLFSCVCFILVVFVRLALFVVSSLCE